MLAKGQVVEVTRLLDSPLYCVVRPLADTDASHAVADGVVPVSVLKPHGTLLPIDTFLVAATT